MHFLSGVDTTAVDGVRLAEECSRGLGYLAVKGSRLFTIVVFASESIPEGEKVLKGIILFL